MPQHRLRRIATIAARVAIGAAAIWGIRTAIHYPDRIAVHQAKLLAPAWFGMEQIGPRVYAGKELLPEPRAQLLAAYQEGRRKVEAFYGTLVTDPPVYGCPTRECIESFGGWGDGFAANHVIRAILLYPKSFTPEAVAHEWSHHELDARIDFFRRRTIPAWFNEGLATVAGGLPQHSEAVYQEGILSGFPVPAMNALVTGKQWGEAHKKYQNPKGLNLVYSTAGHEVRVWLKRVGPQGLQTLIARINRGEDLDTVYADLASAQPQPAS